MIDLSFYKGKKVLVTGHTGFKGSWMCEVLLKEGALLTGYALAAEKENSLFTILKLDERMNSVIGDVRDLAHLRQVFEEVQPEIVIHMAAQPLVRESYKNPQYTYDVNVMGTVNVLECIRNTSCVRSFVNVTTDKVYKNREWEWGYRENEELNGYDPYSNSKSCSELVTESYRNSFFGDREIAVTTMRAGNVIGGGDFAIDRIIPDCIRAAMKDEAIVLRNPYSIRPFQHVLEPVAAYLMVAMRQYENLSLAGSYNVGPDEADCVTVGELTDIFCKEWKEQSGKAVSRMDRYDGGPHEANYLKLDCSKIRKTFSWRPVWNVRQAVAYTVAWAVAFERKEDMRQCVERQIEEYLKCSYPAAERELP